MQTPKVYQNVSIAQLLDWSKRNPNRGHSLAPIRIQQSVEAKKSLGTSMGFLNLPTYSSIPVVSMLGVIAWIRDQMFSDAPTSVQTTIMRDLATTLQTECESLGGGPFARKRRRIHDGIGSVLHGTPVKEEDWKDLFSALGHLTGIHFVFVRDAKGVEEDREDRPEELQGASKGSISFSSEPSTWDHEKPVWIVDYHARWIAVTEDETPTRQILMGWLSQAESNGWIVDWPVVDDTKESLVRALQDEVTWKSSDSKLLKAELAKRLGRIRSIRALSMLSS
jgi:hypothetical protein